MWFARSVDEFHAPFDSDHQKAVLRDTVGLPEETDIDEALAIGRREWAEFIRKHPEFYQQ